MASEEKNTDLPTPSNWQPFLELADQRFLRLSSEHPEAWAEAQQRLLATYYSIIRTFEANKLILSAPAFRWPPTNACPPTIPSHLQQEAYELAARLFLTLAFALAVGNLGFSKALLRSFLLVSETRSLGFAKNNSMNWDADDIVSLTFQPHDCHTAFIVTLQDLFPSSFPHGGHQTQSQPNANHPNNSSGSAQNDIVSRELLYEMNAKLDVLRAHLDS